MQFHNDIKKQHPNSPLTVGPSQERRPQAVDADCASRQPHQESFHVAREGTASERLAAGILKKRSKPGVMS